MKKNRAFSCFLTILMLAITSITYAQPALKIVVDGAEKDRWNTLVKICLDGLSLPADSMLKLEEITGQNRQIVPFQIESVYNRYMWWILSGETKANQKRQFELSIAKTEEPKPIINTTKTDGNITISSHGKNVLRYQYETVYPPAGVDSSFKRSGFIHPLWSVQGVELTCIQPTDHYHHYGIWNPWTKTKYEGQEIDFWNLYKKQGTVRFKDFLSVYNGAVFGGFKALQNHIIYPDSVAEKNVMNEVWDVRVFNQPGNVFMWDFTSSLNLTEKPLTLEEYRYGGFGFRATPYWTKDNTTVLTSQGKARAETDGSLERWCFVIGDTEKGKAGILFLSYPANYNYPEPVRFWPPDSNNGRGDVFFNFSPTKNKDWKLVPGNEYSLKYRVVVFEGEMTAQQAEIYWNDFANPPQISISKVKSEK